MLLVRRRLQGVHLHSGGGDKRSEAVAGGGEGVRGVQLDERRR